MVSARSSRLPSSVDTNDGLDTVISNTKRCIAQTAKTLLSIEILKRRVIASCLEQCRYFALFLLRGLGGPGMDCTAVRSQGRQACSLWKLANEKGLKASFSLQRPAV